MMKGVAQGVSPSAPVFTGAITEIPRAVAYQYSTWTPTDNAGTATNAPATSIATLTATSYITMANASGTLTLTFAKAGNYLIAAHGYDFGNALTTGNLQLYITVGGTATRYITPTTIDLVYSSSVSIGNQAGSCIFMVKATAGQTLTILPTVRVTSASAASNFTADCTITAAYMGT